MLDDEAVLTKVSELLQVPRSRCERHRVLRDVVEDSFALVELVIGLQEEFGVDLIHDDLQSIRTVGDLTQRLQERAAQS